MSSNWYHIKHRKPVAFKYNIRDNPIAFSKENGRFYRDSKRLIRRHLVGDYWVITAFLGLAHGHDDGGKPILFETMILKTDKFENIDHFRASTHRQALALHKQACLIAKSI